MCFAIPRVYSALSCHLAIQVNMEDARCTIIHEAPRLWQEHGYKISILFRLNLQLQ